VRDELREVQLAIANEVAIANEARVAEGWPNGKQPETADRIHSVSQIRSIRSYASREIDFTVPGILAAGTIAAITGDSGTGKSTLTTAMVAAVSNGRPFAGRQTQKRPVLILDRENPLPIVLERFNRLGIDDGDNLKVWGGWAEDEPPNPYCPIIVDWVKQCDPKPVIVVDSFIAFHEGSENDSADMRKTMQGFRRLADLGSNPVLIHHSGKGENTKDYRGSSDFKAGIDVGYVVANLSADPSVLGTVRMKAFKARFTVDVEVILRYHDGCFEADESRPWKTNPEFLRELLIQNPGIRAEEFYKKATDKRLGRNKARVFLMNGIETGAIRVDKGQFNAHYHTWISTPNETVLDE